MFIELLAIWLVLGGMFGIPYLSLLLSAFFIIKLFRPYQVNYFEVSALLIPIVFYLFLTHAIKDRQGFNWGYANLIIVLPAIAALFLGTCSRSAYWIGIAAALIIACLVWLLVPLQGLTKLF